MADLIKNTFVAPGIYGGTASLDCKFLIEKQDKIFIYKHCEVEDDKIHKDGDFQFTLIAKNMGECEGFTILTETLTLDGAGGVLLKIIDFNIPWTCSQF